MENIIFKSDENGDTTYVSLDYIQTLIRELSIKDPNGIVPKKAIDKLKEMIIIRITEKIVSDSIDSLDKYKELF